MKKKNNILLLVFGIIILLLVGQYCFDIFKICKKIPEGMVLVKQETVDSLHAYIRIADSLKTLAHLPSDTIVKYDTIYLDTSKEAITTPKIEIDSTDSSIFIVKDSLIIEGEIAVWIELKLKGYLEEKIKWSYKPIIKKETTVIEKPVPYPVIESVEIPKLVNGHYLSLTAGGNDKLFTFGVDYDLVKEDKIYGLQYQRWGNSNVFGVKVGISLNTLFKK